MSGEWLSSGTRGEPFVCSCDELLRPRIRRESVVYDNYFGQGKGIHRVKAGSLWNLDILDPWGGWPSDEEAKS